MGLNTQALHAKSVQFYLTQLFTTLRPGARAMTGIMQPGLIVFAVS